jgi:hypothetical protein
MRSILSALVLALPLTASAAPFTVQSLQNVTSTVPRATAEQFAQSELWREAYVRCSPWLATKDYSAPLLLHAPKVEPGMNGKDPYIKVTASFECGNGAPDLKQRLASAQEVIVGSVIGIRPVAKTGPISEHDPDMQIATINIIESLEGSACKQIEVRFAASTDVAWFGSPKLHVGQEGVFLAQPGSDGLVLQSPLDVHPTAQRGDIWNVLNQK